MVRETVEMKYGYITYAVLNEGLATTDALGKEMEKLKEEYKAKGFHMKYWGYPFGMSENIVVVLSSDHDLGKLVETYSTIAAPYSAGRTIVASKP